MTAVFKHELSSYFTNLTGYVFGAFLLLFAGIYTLVYNINNAVANFEYVPGSMCFVFIVIVPILTMRVLSEERKQKTDQLLYSLPINMTQVIVGKYAAMLVMLLIPTAIMSIYPFVLSAFGNVSLKTSFSAIIGFFLLGAALIAIGMFISSVTESQAVAAGVCFAVMLLNYFISSLAEYASSSAFSTFAVIILIVIVVSGLIWYMTKNSLIGGVVMLAGIGVTIVLYMKNSESFESILPTVMEKISLFERFYNFINGVFDVTAIVYFISVIAVCLVLSVQSMEKRRWN